jgi:hypothetical protein
MLHRPPPFKPLLSAPHRGAEAGTTVVTVYPGRGHRLRGAATLPRPSASAVEVPHHLSVHVGPHPSESRLLTIRAASAGVAVARASRGSAPNTLAVGVGLVSSCSAGPRQFPVQPGRHGPRDTAAAGHTQHYASGPSAEAGPWPLFHFSIF